MKTFFNSHFHFNGIIHFRISGQCMNSNIQFLGHVCQSSNHSDPQEVPISNQRDYSMFFDFYYHEPQSNICSCVRFVGFFNLIKFKVKAGVLSQISWSCKLFHLRDHNDLNQDLYVPYQWQKLMMIATVIIEFYLPNEFYLYPMVFKSTSFPMQRNVDLLIIIFLYVHLNISDLAHCIYVLT